MGRYGRCGSKFGLIFTSKKEANKVRVDIEY